MDMNGRVQRMDIFCQHCEKEQFPQRNAQTALAPPQTFALISAINVPITKNTQTAHRS